MSKSKRNGTRVIGRFRLSYANIWHPRSFDNSQDAKYSANLLFPKTDTQLYDLLNEAIAEALTDGEERYGKGFKERAKANSDIIKDGDLKAAGDKTDPYYGHWYISASSKKKPGIVGRDREPLTDEDDLVSGFYVNASTNAYPYNYNNMKRGISFGLGNLQKVRGRDEDRLTGGPSARDEFEDIQDEDDEDYGF